MPHRTQSLPSSAAESDSHDRKKPTKLIRVFRNAFRSLPILNPTCRFPGGIGTGVAVDGHISVASRMTGTLFGLRKSRISLAIQENPRSAPLVLLELPIVTAKLLQEMGDGLVRIAMECEKKAGKTKLLEESNWTMYCNGRRAGGAARRDPLEADLNVIKVLQAISMGAGVLPGGAAGDGELTYMRAYFDRVVRSRDSETFYMQNPDGNGGPELTIFFIRI